MTQATEVVPASDVLSSTVSKLQGKYHTIRASGPHPNQASGYYVHLRDWDLTENSGDVIVRNLPETDHKEAGRFATITMHHDGNLYVVEEDFFFGGGRIVGDETVFYPNPLVKRVAELFANLKRGEATHYAPSGALYNPENVTIKDGVVKAGGIPYYESRVRRVLTDKLISADMAMEAVFRDVVGYVEFVKATALLLQK